MRKLDDIAVSADAATRVSNTLVQFGPFDWNALPLETVTPVVGSGEVKSTAYRGVQSAGALNYGWSHTRKDTPAAITITPNGKQTSDPAVTQQMMYPYLYSSNFWNFTGSTMNRSGSDDPDYKGDSIRKLMFLCALRLRQLPSNETLPMICPQGAALTGSGI